MKSAAVLTVDEAFAFLMFFISAAGHGSSQVSPPLGICHPRQKNAYAMPGDSPGWGVGVMLVMILIQALVEDQAHHPSDTGV